ncbi:MAG TPA: hypothetical protein PKD24_04715 [Pyrinomonadaceae bacterium]|nr:hypothetical protein [Pyrinomonadaceae bacterium]HMP64855.1 hypothetical protein [Pyrinomonadaceae bacterium]
MILKQIIFFAFISLIYANPGFSQGPPPPPPPPAYIYSSPAESSLIRFSPEDKSFRAIFPGKPELISSQADGMQISTYRAKTGGATWIVGSVETGREWKGNENAAYLILEGNLSNRPGAKIIEKRDVETGSFKGVEFDVDYKLEFAKNRFFAVGTQLWIIECRVSNWHIFSDLVKEAWREDVSKFFDSVVFPE